MCVASVIGSPTHLPTLLVLPTHPSTHPHKKTLILAPDVPGYRANRQGRSSAWSASASRAPGIYVYVCACTPTMACRLQGTYSTPGVKTNISNGSRIKLGIKSCYYAPACVRQLCAGVERTPSSSRAPMRCRAAGLRGTHVPCRQGAHVSQERGQGGAPGDAAGRGARHSREGLQAPAGVPCPRGRPLLQGRSVLRISPRALNSSRAARCWGRSRSTST